MPSRRLSFRSAFDLEEARRCLTRSFDCSRPRTQKIANILLSFSWFSRIQWAWYGGSAVQSEPRVNRFFFFAVDSANDQFWQIPNASARNHSCCLIASAASASHNDPLFFELLIPASERYCGRGCRSSTLPPVENDVRRSSAPAASHIVYEVFQITDVPVAPALYSVGALFQCAS